MNRNIISEVAPVTSSVRQQTMTSLEAQLVRYARMAASASAAANADYRALQDAVKSGDLIAAQTALDRLNQDNAATAQAATTSSAGSIAPSPETAATPSIAPGSLSATA